MLLLVFALLSTPQPCVEIKQQCRACPTDSKLGCSSVGIACQPTRRLCQPAAAPKREDRRGKKPSQG
jgi:hypothetical protein